MTRLPILLAALALAACGGPDRPPEAAYADYLAAVEARDGDAAYAFLDEAADAGHLGAMAEQIGAHRRGYVSPPGVEGTNLPVRTPLFRLGGLERRFDRTLRDSAAAGSPTALLFVAERLTGHLTIQNDEMTSGLDPADRDSVVALYRRLADSDVARFHLANIAWHLGEDAAALRHLDEAVAAAEPRACSFRLMLTDGFATDGSAASFAAFIDRAEACPTPPGVEGLAARDVRGLLEERERGNAASAVFLDSLGALGVFDRYPHLGALVAEAG